MNAKMSSSMKSVCLGAACALWIGGVSLFGGCASQDLDKASATVDDVNKTMDVVSDVLDRLRKVENAEEAVISEDAEGADAEASTEEAATTEEPAKPKTAVKVIRPVKGTGTIKIRRADTGPQK